MNDSQRLLKGLRPKFDAIWPKQISAQLEFGCLPSDELSFMMSPLDDIKNCDVYHPTIDISTLRTERTYGDYDGDDFRFLIIDCDARVASTQFYALAADASQCLGPWCHDYGICFDDSLIPEILEVWKGWPAEHRWVYALFDLAWICNGEPLFPMRATPIEIDCVKEIEARTDISKSEKHKANELAKQFRLHRSISTLHDIARASVYAIDVLTGKPLAGRALAVQSQAKSRRTRDRVNEVLGDVRKMLKQDDERADKQPVLIAALTKHHRRNDAMNYEPIGVTKLAEIAGVAKSTASSFFTNNFDGHKKYKDQCADGAKLDNALKLLNGEIPPRFLNRSLSDANQIADDD